jgi:hypothetical protein
MKLALLLERIEMLAVNAQSASAARESESGYLTYRRVFCYITAGRPDKSFLLQVLMNPPQECS